MNDYGIFGPALLLQTEDLSAEQEQELDGIHDRIVQLNQRMVSSAKASGSRKRALLRRRMAMHEAAHFVVAEYLGAKGIFAALREVPGDHPTWEGQCWNSNSGEPLSVGETALITVAGAVGEMIWVVSYWKDEDPDDVIRLGLYNAEGDWTTLHANRVEISSALKIVRELLSPGVGRKRLLEVARALMHHGTVRSGSLNAAAKRSIKQWLAGQEIAAAA